MPFCMNLIYNLQRSQFRRLQLIPEDTTVECEVLKKFRVGYTNIQHSPKKFILQVSSVRGSNKIEGYKTYNLQMNI